MPLEIEIKLKVDSHDAVRERLRTAGAVHQSKVRETNCFFDRPDRSLRESECSLRVRFSVADGKRQPIALLTFKRPPQKEDALQSREAFDLTLTPHDQIVPLLEALGFQQQFLFEKERETWVLGGCQVELDTLPHFGRFLEIEGPSEEAVRRVQGMLGMEGVPPHHASYSRIVSEHLRERESRELRF